VSWVDEELVAEATARYGAPATFSIELEISRPERDLVLLSTAKGRYHDVTFFVLNGDRLALIRKPHYRAGWWRPPGGGIAQGEDLEAGVAREAREELGVGIVLRRYLVQASAVFTHGGLVIPWTTHVFEASTEEDDLDPLDTREIAEARWGTLDELAGPIRERLLASGRALWRYRVALHDAADEAIREHTA
jgi:ADP-ribose pyrophosphatase YjhB (NUDIX family)